MADNKNLETQIADDLSAVLKEAKKMGCKKVTSFSNIPLENVETVIKALTEIQTYRAIGTVEEFKTLKEKREPKKPITYIHTHRADCPNCRATVRGIDKPFGDYCSKCGIKLDWSE